MKIYLRRLMRFRYFSWPALVLPSSFPLIRPARALPGLTEFAAGTAKEHRRIPELPPEPATGNPYRYESGGTGFRLMLPNRRDLQFSGPPDLKMQQ